MKNNKRWSFDWFDYNNKKQLKKRVKVNVCGVCLEKLGEDKQLHHILYFVDCGLSDPENLCWLHPDCHKKLHRSDNNLRRKIKYRKNLQRLKSEGII